MSYSHLIYMIEYNRDNEFLVFLGFILSIYLFHHFLKVRKITKEQDDILHQGVELVEETDVLGMKKIVYENTSNYTTLDKLMSWKVFVLMSLIFISVYLIYSNRSDIKGFNMVSSEYTILAPAEALD